MKTFQLKIVVKDSKPPIWRRISLPQESTFDALHNTIQALFGFDNSHLHEFSIPDLNIRVYDDDELSNCISGVNSLDFLLKVGMKFRYWYDFGDDWFMNITVEKESEQEEDYPIIMKAKGENLIEDIGGIWRYYNAIYILEDKQHPKYESIKEWVGDLDDYKFNLQKAQNKLSRIHCARVIEGDGDVTGNVINTSIQSIIETLFACDDSIVTFQSGDEELHAWLHNGDNIFLVVSESLDGIYKNIRATVNHNLAYPWYISGFFVSLSEDYEILIEIYENQIIRDLEEVEKRVVAQYLNDLANVLEHYDDDFLPSYERGKRVVFEKLNSHEELIEEAVDTTFITLNPEDEELAGYTKGKEKLEISCMPIPDFMSGEFIRVYYIFINGTRIKMHTPLKRMDIEAVKEEIADFIRVFVNKHGRPKSISIEDPNILNSLRPLGELLHITMKQVPSTADYSNMMKEIFQLQNPIDEEEERAMLVMQNTDSDEELDEYLWNLPEALRVRILGRIGFLSS